MKSELNPNTNAFHGPLWAVTARFTEKLEGIVINSNDAPAMYLKKRFDAEFNRSVPRAGVFDFFSRTGNNRLHVHMLLPVSEFPDPDALKQRLHAIFGTVANEKQIHIQPTREDDPFNAMKTFGIETSGPEGWMLYGAKSSSLTRNKLECSRRRYDKVGGVRICDRLQNKGLQICINSLGLELDPHKFYFDDMVFKSHEVGVLARKMWDECQADFIDLTYLRLESAGLFVED